MKQRVETVKGATPVTATEGRGPFFLEKWYLDMLFDDGSLLILLLGQLRACGFRRARVAVELHRPDGPTIRGDASVGAIVPAGAGRTFDAGRLEPSEITWYTPALSGHLRLAPRYPPTRLRDPLLIDGVRRLRWIVEVPDADVDGELMWQSGWTAVTGRGYRDYVALDLLPWRIPLRELRWGRAVAGEHARCWISLRMRHRTIDGTWNDGIMAPRCMPPPLSGERVIQEAHVADLPMLRIGPLRTALRRLAGDPHQTRSIARTTLCDTRGWAVHEVVRWR